MKKPHRSRLARWAKPAAQPAAVAVAEVFAPLVRRRAPRPGPGTLHRRVREEIEAIRQFARLCNAAPPRVTRQQLRAWARRREKNARSERKAHAMEMRLPGGAAEVR